MADDENKRSREEVEKVRLELSVLNEEKEHLVNQVREVDNEAVRQRNNCERLEKLTTDLYERVEKTEDKFAREKMDMEERLKSSKSSREKQNQTQGSLFQLTATLNIARAFPIL